MIILRIYYNYENTTRKVQRVFFEEV